MSERTYLIVRTKAEIITNLVKCHSAKLATYAKSLGVDAAYAKDAANESFLRLCKLENIKEDTAVSWLYKVCRNYVFNEIKRRSCETSYENADAFPVVDVSLRGDEKCEENESFQILLDEIRKLNPTQREVIFMRFYNRLEYSQISFILGISVSNVGVIISRAIAIMRKNLKGIL